MGEFRDVYVDKTKLAEPIKAVAVSDSLMFKICTIWLLFSSLGKMETSASLPPNQRIGQAAYWLF